MAADEDATVRRRAIYREEVASLFEKAAILSANVAGLGAALSWRAWIPRIEHRLDPVEKFADIDVTLEADDVPELGPCIVRAVQRVVDAQDQVRGSGRAKTLELGLQVARRPESDDLQQHASRRVASMMDREVWKDQMVARSERLRLADQIPAEPALRALGRRGSSV